MLLRFCERYELDPHLIDDEISYSENMDYLRLLVPELCQPENRLDEVRAMEDEYYATRPLEAYIIALREGKGPKYENYVDPDSFSLREWVRAH